MTTGDRTELRLFAMTALRRYLATGLAGFFAQAWDRLREAGYDVGLRAEATEANARALLWLVENRE